ncbi:hypothetical protein [Chryseobacterium sp. Leaf201]|uniref:hypothetical protein n=1 Tax=Chryseobacterium sp. Leaf201 TaxID=1735672 RepID=UPI000A440988|nr:hypothetical protein [Chryseobacterium sp. Leaf201]
MNLEQHKEIIADKGYSVISNVFSGEEIEKISEVIRNTDPSKETFRKSEDLFAIRQFLKEIPEVRDLVFNDKIKEICKGIFGEKYIAVKVFILTSLKSPTGMLPIIRT